MGKRGRPRKKKGSIAPHIFGRSLALLAYYDEARRKDQKQHDAIAETVESFNLDHPSSRISVGEVKRVLASSRPPQAETVIVVERSKITKLEQMTCPPEISPAKM
jgi:hypothetical protein